MFVEETVNLTYRQTWRKGEIEAGGVDRGKVHKCSKFGSGLSSVVVPKLSGTCLVLGRSPCSLWPSFRTLLK